MSKATVLDHGYVEYVEHFGSDESVICAARMSTAQGFKGWGTPEKPGDEKLLRYLWTHGHSSCFEMAGMVLEVQMPVFVERQFQRHRTLQWFSINELSARYTEVPDQVYVPSLERLRNGGQSKSNKQASGEQLDEGAIADFQQIIRLQSKSAFNAYRIMLEQGVARELARSVLPVNMYTRMRISGNLWNWTRLLSKRLPDDAQWESREYAKVISDLLWERFPRTMELFENDKS